MHAKRIFIALGCIAMLGTAGLGLAEPRPRDAHAPGLSPSERMRMRGDLERFSQQHPQRARIEMRRQMLRERARRRFHDADHDGNGYLNRQELSRINPNAARHFDQIDRDQDGEVSEQEVGQVLRRRMQGQYPRDESFEP